VAHEKLHEEGNDEIIHRKFAGTVSARMLVADAGWRRGGAWWASRSRMNRPSAEQLAFSKEKEVPGDALVGVSILYNWRVVGWCVGQVVERNTDGRLFKTIGGERVKVNFLIFYEIAQQTVKTVLRLDDHDSEWVLLASIDTTVPIEPGPEPGAHSSWACGPGPDVDADM